MRFFQSSVFLSFIIMLCLGLSGCKSMLSVGAGYNFRAEGSIDTGTKSSVLDAHVGFGQGWLVLGLGATSRLDAELQGLTLSPELMLKIELSNLMLFGRVGMSVIQFDSIKEALDAESKLVWGFGSPRVDLGLGIGLTETLYLTLQAQLTYDIHFEEISDTTNIAGLVGFTFKLGA